MSGNEFRVGQIFHGLCHVHGSAIAAYRSFFRHFRQDFRLHIGAHICQNHAGCHAVDPDAAGAKLLRQGLGQSNHRALGGRICRLAGGPHLSPHTGHGDDAAPVLFQKRRHGCVDAVVNSLDVHRKDPVPGTFVHHGHKAKMHEPMQTRICVLIPAGWLRCSRSQPIIPETTVAKSKRIKTSFKVRLILHTLFLHLKC